MGTRIGKAKCHPRSPCGCLFLHRPHSLLSGCALGECQRKLDRVIQNDKDSAWKRNILARVLGMYFGSYCLLMRSISWLNVCALDVGLLKAHTSRTLFAFLAQKWPRGHCGAGSALRAFSDCISVAGRCSAGGSCRAGGQGAGLGGVPAFLSPFVFWALQWWPWPTWPVESPLLGASVKRTELSRLRQGLGVVKTVLLREECRGPVRLPLLSSPLPTRRCFRSRHGGAGGGSPAGDKMKPSSEHSERAQRVETGLLLAGATPRGRVSARLTAPAAQRCPLF